MNKKTALISGLLGLTLLGAVVVADFFGLVGVKQDIEVMLFEVRFKIVDADTGGLIVNARAKCTRRGSDNACTNRDSRAAGVIAINIPARYAVEKTRLFEKNRALIPPSDPNIHVFFIHNDYYHSNRTFKLADIFNAAGREIVIKMAPKA